MSNSQGIIAWIGVALGVYGAVLSTANFLSQRREKKKKLKVSMDYILDDKFVWSARVKVTNIGKHSIIMEQLGIILPNGNKVNVDTVPLFKKTQPVEIAEGNKTAGTRKLEDVFKSEKEPAHKGKTIFKPYCRDSLDNYYYGKSVVYEGIESLLDADDD